MFVLAAIRSRAVLFFVVIVGALGITSPLNALPRDPALSRTQIAFVEASQLWVMPRRGGLATRVSDLPGRNFTPRFSPDGQRIAFSSNEAQDELRSTTRPVGSGKDMASIPTCWWNPIQQRWSPRATRNSKPPSKPCSKR